MLSDEDLRQVLLDQREELKGSPPAGKWVPRTQEKALREALRRSGKSALARPVLADRLFAYVNFDDERLTSLRTDDLQRAGHNLVGTGSNSKLLSRELATHLTGRAAGDVGLDRRPGPD